MPIKMKICILSDTHFKHQNIIIPQCDVLIHCGDFTNVGGINEINQFMNWFSNQHQCKHKIIIAGNHDLLFEKEASFARTLVPDNVYYLCNETIIIDNVKFYGTPYQPNFFPQHWAFNLDSDKLSVNYNMIPIDIDVLITHCPPAGILDITRRGEPVGSYELFDKVIQTSVKLHCFGHIHNGYGILERHNKTFINGSILDDRYYITNKPVTHILNF